MLGTLMRGVELTGPELFVDTENGLFPVAVTTLEELTFLRTWIGNIVKFTPKVCGTRTNLRTRKIEAVVFATNVRSEHIN